MSQVAPRASIFACRRCEVQASSSQATPTVQGTPLDSKGEHEPQVTRRLLFPHEIHNLVSRTTFLGQQQINRQTETKTARRRRPKNLQRSRPVLPYNYSVSNLELGPGNNQPLVPKPCDRTRYHDSPARHVPYSVPKRPASGSFTSCEYGHETTNDTNDALLAMSQLLDEASDLQGAVARGEIRIEEQIEPLNVVTVDRVDASSEQATKELVLGNAEQTAEEKKDEEEKVRGWQSLQQVFGLDQDGTKALFEGTYDDRSSDSMCDMYLPTEVPSVDHNVTEVLSSPEFLELMALLDYNQPQSGATNHNYDAQLISTSSSDKHENQKSLSEVCSSETVTTSKGGKQTSRVRLEKNASDPWQDYVPDMFLFTSIEHDVKFDLFDQDFESVRSDDVTTCMTSRKRKRCSSDVSDSKRARGNWLPETFQGTEVVY